MVAWVCLAGTSCVRNPRATGSVWQRRIKRLHAHFSRDLAQLVRADLIQTLRTTPRNMTCICVTEQGSLLCTVVQLLAAPTAATTGSHLCGQLQQDVRISSCHTKATGAGCLCSSDTARDVLVSVWSCMARRQDSGIYSRPNVGFGGFARTHGLMPCDIACRRHLGTCANQGGPFHAPSVPCRGSGP